MPIQIETQSFEDIFGNVLPYYQANPGDISTAIFRVRSAIRLSSVNNPLTYDPVLQQITSSTISWLEEGFRVGDWVLFVRYNSQGSGLGQAWTQINYVDDFVCDLDFFAASFMPNIQNGESLVFLAVEGNGSFTARSRDNLDTLINQVLNTSSGAPQSLIDGEVTRAVFPGVAALLPGGTVAGQLVGNQSGNYLASAVIERDPDGADGFLRHSITFQFSQSGAYNEAWFDSGTCLKAFLRLEWASIGGEPYERAVETFDFDANTGFYDQAHNSSIANSVLVQGITELDYCQPKTFDLIVDGPTSEIGIGAQYISTDPSYYKNRIFPQQNISMLTSTFEAVPGVTNSQINEFGAQYSVEINSINSIGSVTTVNITFTPNAQFASFIEGRDIDDRLFYLWIKCGNINHAAYETQLLCEPVTSGPLVMVQDFGYLDHSENVTTIAGNQTGFIADTEDDIGYLGTFLLTKGETFDNFIVKIEAFNTGNNQDFTLQQVVFSFAGVQISNDGRYLLNESATSVTTLPTTSEKREFLLVLEPTLDTPTEYGVKIYAPWLLDWRYWIEKTDANVDFFPTQNQNWEQYDDPADWVIRTELQLVKDGFAQVHTNELSVLPYDAEDDLEGTIELLIESTLQVVQVAPTNTLMRIRYTEVNQTGAFDPSLVWGMVTVEPKESGPRSICSSVVPYDGNTQNPLTPLIPTVGEVINIQFPQPDTAVFECLFDTSKIDLTNGVKIGGKIKENDKSVDDPILNVTREAEFAFSLRKVSSDSVYPDASPCIRVRRTSDNAEQDIGFAGVPLVVDQDELSSFAGSAELYVVTVYDQSGWNNHATNSAASEQQRIWSDGLPELLNGKICFNANPPSGIKAPYNLTILAREFQTSFSVARIEVFNSINYISGALSANGIFFGGTNAGYDGFGIQAGLSFSLLGEDLNQHLGYSNQRSGNVYLAVDGSAESNIGPGNPTTDNINFVGGKKLGTNLYLRGQWHELIAFNSDRSTDKNLIESNINNFYNIY
jgi:hypothetical protein